jgi:hypothetical protein
MKAVLEFNLPEDHQEFECATKAHDLYFVMWDMDQHLRNKLKYESENMSEEVYKALQETRDHLHNLMAERRVDFEMLA